MDNDYDTDDELSCPACGHSPLHSRDCINFDCNEGYIDTSEEDYLVEGSREEQCNECKGTGIERWCPNCGKELSGHDFSDQENQNNNDHFPNEYADYN